jgi:hypothetical protein
VEQPEGARNLNAIELAVLDAPVLARGALTQFLLHLADGGAFDPVWSDQIHGEWLRELQRLRPDIPMERLHRRRAELDRAFPVANVIASRDAQDEVLAYCTTAAERKSAHVLATALSARASVIVTDATFCLGEVMSKVWHDTAALSPDDWCIELLERRQPSVLAGCRAHRASWRCGDGSIDAWIEWLRDPRVGLRHAAELLGSLRDQL